jgi:hypothetical protein
MRLRYTLILALLIHIVSKSVWTLIIAIYQFVKSFIEKMRPVHVIISWLHFEHLHWSGSSDLWGAFSSLRIDGRPAVLNQNCVVDVEELASHKSSRVESVLSCKESTVIRDDGGITHLWNVVRQLFWQKTILNFILTAVRTWNLT